MADVLNMDWLRMFDHRELQTLISGAEVPVDVDDLKQHTNYFGMKCKSLGVTEDFLPPANEV